MPNSNNPAPIGRANQQSLFSNKTLVDIPFLSEQIISDVRTC